MFSLVEPPSRRRFELREDRKREAALSVRQLDTLRRDIFKGSTSPATLEVPGPATSIQQLPLSPYYGLLSPEEVDQLRLQVVNSVREELRHLARDLHMQHCHRPPHQAPLPARPPPLPPDLYQTHLFTQL